MKRVLILILILSIFVCGCAQQEPEVTDEEQIVVGISQVGAESDWRIANSESMKSVFTEENGYRLLFEDARQIQENQIMAVRKFIQQQVDYIVLMPLSESGWESVEENGYRLLFEDARQIQENQIMAVRKFIQQQVDYIVLMPLSESGWESVLQEARNAGIPVILVDRMVDVQDETLYTAHVGSDFYEQGRKATGWMEKKYAAQADTVEIIHIRGTLGSTVQIGRTSALEDAVAAYDNWEVLTCLDGDFTQAKTYEVMCQYLDTLPKGQDIDIVYCENDNEAFGAIEALEQRGYVCGKDVDVICFDATRNALRFCMEGKIALAVESNPLLGAIEALEQRGYVCGKDVDVICFDATRNALRFCMEGKIALAVESNPLLGPLVAEIIQTLENGDIPAKQHYVEEQQFTKDGLTEEIISEREY